MKVTDKLRLEIFEDDDLADLEAVNSNFRKIESALGTEFTTVLYAGNTTVEIIDGCIKENSLIDIYTDNYKVSPKNVTYENGKIRMTFRAQSINVVIKVVVK